MKRFLAMMMTVVLLAGCFAPPASASISLEKFLRTFEITRVDVNDNGTLMVYWTDSANKGPYTLMYEQHVSDLYTSDQQNKILRYTAIDSTYNDYGKIKYAEPCADYWITVRDKEGTTTRYAYKPSRFRNFTEFTVGLESTLHSQRGSNKTTLKRFSADDIFSASFTDWTVQLKITHSQLKKKRVYGVHFSVVDPQGTILAVFFDSSLVMPQGVSSQGYNLTLNSAFEAAERIHGQVLTGQYTINMYFDGKFVNSVNFRVGQ